MKSPHRHQGHIARKRFGQNFLIAQDVIKNIVDAIAPRDDDVIVEIGPGLGALTDPLLQRIGHLQVVEIDRDLIARLRSRYPVERLTIHEGDALEFDFGALKTAGPMKIIGNLPYNISSPLLFHLVAFSPLVAEMYFMLQKEVVDRMVAGPGSSEFGRLSVMLQYRYQMECLFVVPPESFNPAPKVESAIVRMIPRRFDLSVGADETKANTKTTTLQGGRAKDALCAVACDDTPLPTAIDESRFANLVMAAFSQRRKMLRNTLKSHIAEADLAALGINPMARAEDIAVADYVRLSNFLTASNA